jgi:cell division protein FtsB
MQDLLQMLAVASAVIVGIFVVHYFRYRTAVAHSMASATDSAAKESEKLRGEVAALKERVEVLERIVTDNRYDLQAKIANL